MRSTEEAANGDGCLFYPGHVNEAIDAVTIAKGIITKDELMATIERLDREMEEQRGK